MYRRPGPLQGDNRWKGKMRTRLLPLRSVQTFLRRQENYGPGVEGVAQLVERRTFNPQVVGSTPTALIDVR